MSTPTPGIQKTFPLDPKILGPASALSLELSGATAADVALAVAENSAFPTRPSGQIDLAHIGLTATGANSVAFQSGQVSVGFEISAGVSAGAGIFDDPNKALAALDLGETPGLDLTVDSSPGTRYALLKSRYQASGSVSGTHPIGALGSFTFGVSGASSGVSAVLHRFTQAEGARTVLEQTISSWKLPRHVGSAAGLAPSTWVIAEADGSLAVKLGASLGYNFNFIRETRVAGLSGDIGLEIDAAANASFGFDVSGRYLVVLGRESDSPADQHLRLRLFKLSNNGLQLGLNLKIGVTGVETLAPDRVDDFVKAVFGVHGAQIVKALTNIQSWTGKTQSVGQLVAGLTNDKALELLRTLTDIDPDAAFEAARTKLLDAIHLYQSLPSKVSSEFLTILNTLDAPASRTFQDALNLLASNDAATQKKALLDIFNTTGFSITPAGQLVSALADKGLLNLLDRLPEVRQVASTVLTILDGGVITRLQQFINDKLDLNTLLAVAQETDFNALDSFLVGRLSVFFDRDLHFADLEDIKRAIHVVVSKRQEIYSKALKALHSRYGLDLATTWQKTTSNAAVFDVVFDTSQAQGKQMLSDLVQDSNFDTFLLNQSPAVHLNAAVLTHEITRKSTIDLTLPHFNFQSQSFNQAMANVRAEDDGGRVLLYETTGEDVVAVRNKFRSSLAVTIAAAVSNTGVSPLSDLRVHSTDAATWSYQLLHAKAKMGREELEAYTRPFIQEFMTDQFKGNTNLSFWYNQFDRTVENILNNGPEDFGDLCARFEVTMPGETLGAWTTRMPDVTSAAKRMSKAIQKALKHVVPFYYLTDISKLHDRSSSAALLTWSAMRPTNDILIDGNTITFDVGNKVFWDQIDPDKRKLMVDNPITAQNLLAMLGPLRLRLEEARRHGDVQFYQDNQVPALIGTATSSGDVLVLGLLTFESVIVNKAAEALNDIQKFLAAAGSSPSQAIVRLADFAADITTAFNKLIGNTVFGGLSFRAVSQAVFAEASIALDPALTTRPRAMLVLNVLRPQPPRTFNLPDFLNGAIPPVADIAVSQHLVSA
jgi:hypothetical protein